MTQWNDAFCGRGEEPAVGIIAEQCVGRGAADRVFFEVSVGWRRPGQRFRSAIEMSEILEQLDHPFWGTVQRRSGYDGWDLEQTDSLPDGTDVKLRFDFDDPDDQTVQENYSLIRARWSELWPRIVDRIGKMKTYYGYGNATYDPTSDWFSISVPEIRIEDGAEWSVMLQATEAGWLIDFQGWKDFGGQGVF